MRRRFRREELQPEHLHWLKAVEAAAAANDITLDGDKEWRAMGAAAALMFHARCAAKGHPEVLAAEVELLLEGLGLTLADVEAVGVA